MKFKLAYLIAFVAVLFFHTQTMEAQPFVNAQTYGVTGNGVDDDAPMIREALKAGINLYFPPGKYKLCSLNEDINGNVGNHFLTLSSINNGTMLYWHKDAVFFVCKEFFQDNRNPIQILQIRNKPDNGQPNGNVENITLISPNIDGNNVIHTTWSNPRIGGITLYEDDDENGVEYDIEGINIIRPNVQNCTGSGIGSSSAKQVDIHEAYTKNNRKQGIGVRNSHNKDAITLNIYGHTSEDDFQSIDWSGNDGSDTECDEEFTGIGDAYNLVSINSKTGIKTAGTWNLDIRGMEITGSKGNGFWNNCNAPNAITKLERVRINNCANNGISLKESTVIIKDAIISENGCDFISAGANLKIDDMTINSNNVNGCGMRIRGDNVHVNNFTINAKNIDGGQYALWLYGNTVMSNGEINSQNQGVIVRGYNGQSATTCFENVVFKSGKNGITSIGDNNHTFLKDCSFDSGGMDVRLIDDNGQTLIVSNTEVNPDVGQQEDDSYTCTLPNDFTNNKIGGFNTLIVKNYPNPFTQKTTIEFTLMSDSSVNLFVSDLAGRQIVSLLNDEYRNKGTHQITFDARSYPAGIYYFTIQVGEYITNQKLTLVR